MNIKTEPSTENEGDKAKEPSPSLRRSSRTHKGNKLDVIIKPFLKKVKKEPIENPEEVEASNSKEDLLSTATAEAKSGVDKVVSSKRQLRLTKSSSTDTAETESGNSDDNSNEVVREHSYAVKLPFELTRFESVGLSGENPRLESYRQEMAFYQAHLDHTYSCVTTNNSLEAIKMKYHYECPVQLSASLYTVKFPSGSKEMSNLKFEPKHLLLPPFKDMLPNRKRKVSINHLNTKRFKRLSPETLLLPSRIGTPKIQMKRPTKANVTVTKGTKKLANSKVASQDFFLRKRKGRRNKTGWPNPLKKQLNEEPTTVNSKIEPAVKRSPKKVEKKKNLKESVSRKSKSNEIMLSKLRLRNNIKGIESSSIFESIEEAVKNRHRNKRNTFEVTGSNVKKEKSPQKATNTSKKKLSEEGNAKVEEVKSLSKLETREEESSQEKEGGTGTRIVRRLRKRLISLLPCTNSLTSPESSIIKEEQKLCGDIDEGEGDDENQQPNTEDVISPPAEASNDSSNVAVRPQKRGKKKIFHWSRKKSLMKKNRNRHLQEKRGATTSEIAATTTKTEKIEPDPMHKKKISLDHRKSVEDISSEQLPNIVKKEHISSEEPTTDSVDVSPTCASFPKTVKAENVNDVVESRFESPSDLACSETFSNSENSLPTDHQLVENTADYESIAVAETLASTEKSSDGSQAENVLNEKNCILGSEDIKIVESETKVTVIEVSDDSEDSDWESCLRTNNDRSSILNDPDDEKSSRPKELDKTIRNNTVESFEKSVKGGSSRNKSQNQLKNDHSDLGILIESTHSITTNGRDTKAFHISKTTSTTIEVRDLRTILRKRNSPSKPESSPEPPTAVNMDQSLVPEVPKPPKPFVVDENEGSQQDYVPYDVPPLIKKLYPRVQKRLGIYKAFPRCSVTSGRPPFPYVVLAGMAIEHSPVKAVRIRGITDFALEHFPFYSTHKSKWKINLRMRIATCRYFRPVKIVRNVFYTFNEDYRLEDDPDNMEPNKLLMLLHYSGLVEAQGVTSFHPLDHLLESNSFSQYHLNDKGNDEEHKEVDEEIDPLIPVCSYSDADSDHSDEEPAICPKVQSTGGNLGITQDPLEGTPKEAPSDLNLSSQSKGKRVFPCRYASCKRMFGNFEAILDHIVKHEESMKHCPICEFATLDCIQLFWHVNVHR